MSSEWGGGGLARAMRESERKDFTFVMYLLRARLRKKGRECFSWRENPAFVTSLFAPPPSPVSAFPRLEFHRRGIVFLLSFSRFSFPFLFLSPLDRAEGIEEIPVAIVARTQEVSAREGVVFGRREEEGEGQAGGEGGGGGTTVVKCRQSGFGAIVSVRTV